MIEANDETRETYLPTYFYRGRTSENVRIVEERQKKEESREKSLDSKKMYPKSNSSKIAFISNSSKKQ